MRRVILCSAVLVVAACSDDHQTTAPALARANAASSVSDAQKSASVRVPSAGQRIGELPTPGERLVADAAVPFSKITVVTSPEISLNKNSWGFGTAICPAGKKVVGGGYSFGYPPATSALPMMMRSMPYGASAWEVDMSNYAVGAWDATYYVYAVCIS